MFEMQNNLFLDRAFGRELVNVPSVMNFRLWYKKLLSSAVECRSRRLMVLSRLVHNVSTFLICVSL